MNYKIKEFMKNKNHSVAFLRLISAELYEENKDLSKSFLELAERKREYENTLLKVINDLDNSNIIFREIMTKAYYDYDEYNNLEFSSEKEELAYLLEILKEEEEMLNNKNLLLKSYLNEKEIA